MFFQKKLTYFSGQQMQDSGRSFGEMLRQKARQYQTIIGTSVTDCFDLEFPEHGLTTCFTLDRPLTPSPPFESLITRGVLDYPSMP